MSYQRLFIAVVLSMLLLVTMDVDATISPDKNYNPQLAMKALNYCKATNCHLDRISNWTCGPGCLGVGGASSFTDITLVTNKTFDSLGFVGFNREDKTIVYAIRGSRNFLNWVADLDFKLVPYQPHDECPGDCQVHHGFFDVFTDLHYNLMPAFAALMKKYPNASVLVTGHSLGAAVATLSAVDIGRTYPELLSPQALHRPAYNVYTFGCPRVGNPAFASYAASIFPQGIQHRLTHDEDPVPHLPPQKWGFLHTPSEVFFKGNTSTEYVLCDDSKTAEDPKCSDSELPLNPRDHIWYLGECMGCCDPNGSDNCCKKLPL